MYPHIISVAFYISVFIVTYSLVTRLKIIFKNLDNLARQVKIFYINLANEAIIYDT